MHGYLRFCLATLVVLSHLGHAGPINIGVAGVVVFYMLSGYVVTHLINKFFPFYRLKEFYIERFLRIYPLYLVFLLLVSLFLATTNYGSPNWTFAKVIFNLTIIPLNYYMFVDVAVVRDHCILPPAWSLGAEIQAYFILPFILRSISIKWIAGISSLLVFSLAALGYLDPDIWGYRLLPGIIFIFLTGAAICKTIKIPELTDSFDRKFPFLCWGWLLTLLIGLSITSRLHPFSAATILGFLIGMPIVFFTSTSVKKLPFDRILGQLSYGVFLIHMPVSWVFEYLGGAVTSKRSFIFVILISSLLSAAATFIIEKRVWSIRKELTKSEKI